MADTPEKSEREAAQKNIAENRKAYHDYHVLETFEAVVGRAGQRQAGARQETVGAIGYVSRTDGQVLDRAAIEFDGAGLPRGANVVDSKLFRRRG